MKEIIEIKSYKNTLDNLLIEHLKGKYFQNILSPHLIAQIPKELSIYLIENNELSAWFPLQKKWRGVNLNEFKHYAEISEEQFKKYENYQGDFSKILLVHENSEAYKNQKSKIKNQTKLT
ncbi:MAG: hypothetical protein Q8O84_00620 [Nanoarchaeota archaeon]|nr:hypothetical protein [Nanoarchaeota archaeon]